MLSTSVVETLREVLRQLGNPGSCGAWGALAPLHALAGAGMDVTIDLGATEAVGAPVIVARPRPALLLGALTPRQREVAALILAGRSNKAIATELAIGLATVKDHVHAILGRLGLSSRAELISLALSVRS